MYCPNCGKEILNRDAVFCPYCSKPLRVVLNEVSPPIMLTKKHSGFPTAAGILTIIAASIVIIFGLLAYESFASEYPYYATYTRYPIPYYLYADLITGIALTICFGFGLAAGILTIKRRRFAFSMIGTSLLLVTSLYMLTEDFVGSAFLAVPVLILLLLSVVFVAISKGEFT